MKILLLKGLVILMKKVYKLIGTALLSVAALFVMVGPASVGGIAVEEMPNSIKNKR